MEQARSSERRIEAEREEQRSRVADLQGRLERERLEGEKREEERAKELCAKRERQIDAKERSYRGSVALLLSSELAFESSLTCMACLSVMSCPVTCTPCGHSLCAGCFEAAGTCAECGGGGGAVPNSALDALCGKFSLRVQELEGLQRALR